MLQNVKSVRAANTLHDAHLMAMQPSERTYHLQASNKDEMNDWLFRLHRVIIDYVIEGLAKKTEHKRRSSRRRGSRGEIRHVSPEESLDFKCSTREIFPLYLSWRPQTARYNPQALPLHQATPGRESDMTSPGTYFSTPQSDSALDSGRFERFGATTSMLRKTPSNNPNSSRALFLADSPDRTVVVSPPTPNSTTAQPALTPKYVPPFRRKRANEDGSVQLLGQSLAEIAISINKETDDLRRSFDSGSSSEGLRRSSDGSLGKAENSMFDGEKGRHPPKDHRPNFGVSCRSFFENRMQVSMEDYHDLRRYFYSRRSIAPEVKYC